MGRILAIDFGLKRTGLAVTDPGKRIASGLAGLDTSRLMEFLDRYLRENDVERFVVGEPRHLDNTASGPVAAIEAMVKQLQKRFGKPVARMDERFTSLIAARALVDGGVPRMKRRDKSLVDTVSAVLILQSFLEQEEGRARS